KLAKCVRQVIAGFAIFAYEARAAVDVPTDNVDRPVGVAHGVPHRGEILGRVDEYGGTVGAFDPPRISAGQQDPRLLRPGLGKVKTTNFRARGHLRQTGPHRLNMESPGVNARTRA